MKDVLITSSALILALLVLRRLFRNTLSRRVQYALWGLVLIRLLIPASLPAVDFSVLTAARPVEQAVTERVSERPIYVPVARAPLSEHPTAPDLSPERVEFPEAESVWVVADDDTAVRYKKLSLEALLSAVWKAGIAVMGGFFVLSNAAFDRRLRKRREPFSPTERFSSTEPFSPKGPISRKIYIVPDGVLPSPCLFGRSIYLTPAAVASPDTLRHVLAHEETHERHLDPLWALLRCVCLTVYWFDPLVWIAATCSKADCELACDEGALARLGEQERIPYGQTLLSLIPVRKGLGNPLTTATTMTAGKRQLRERVTRIAQKPRQLAAAVSVVLVLAGIATACTFTGANKSTSEPAKLAASVPELGEPERIISLADAPLYTSEPYTLEHKYEWWTEQVELYAEGDPYDVYLLTSYEDQMQHFAVVDKYLERPDYLFFLSIPLGNFYGGGGFDDELFGYNGPVQCISYRSAEGEDVCDYFYIATDGAPVRLLQTLGPLEESFHMDCDGDGTNEVVATTELFFQREDGVHREDVHAIWQETYPAHTWYWGQWDLSTGLLKATGFMTEEDVFHFWMRYLRFDGENLLVYRDPRTCEDHVMSGIDVPGAVLDKAKELTQAWYLGTRLDGELYQNESAPGHEDWQTAEYDDWRVENLSGPEVCQVGGITLHAYQFNYEYHTATPRFVVLSGGMYITEDGWVKPGQGRLDYLFFRLEEDGSLTFLWHESSDEIGMTPQHLAQPGLKRLGLLQNDPAYLVQSLWDELTASEGTTLNLIPADRVGGGVYSTDVARGWNVPRDVTSDFRLEMVASARVIMDTTDVLTVENGDKSITFYQEPKLVEYRNGARDLWFRVENTIEDDVFAFELFEQIRRWYDEVEYEAMSADIVISDRGQSREELVKEWTQQYEGTHLAVTPGSKFKCTYIAVRDIEVDTEVGYSPYLATIGDREAFRFWYSTIFVPESNETLNWMMAGNTAEYEGDDAPDHAFQYWHTGHLYLADDGWRCEGVGTG